MTKLDRPPLKITVQVETDDGPAEREIKWTYGLSQDIQRVVPNAAAVLDVIAGDPMTREYIMRRALTPSRKMIEKLEELVDPGEVGLDDPDEQNKLLNWVTGHLLYFFVTSAGGLKELGEAFGQHLKSFAPPEPSSAGSKA